MERKITQHSLKKRFIVKLKLRLTPLSRWDPKSSHQNRTKIEWFVANNIFHHKNLRGSAYCVHSTML